MFLLVLTLTILGFDTLLNFEHMLMQNKIRYIKSGIHALYQIFSNALLIAVDSLIVLLARKKFNKH